MDTLEYFKAHLSAYLEELEALVRLETPSRDLARLARAADWLEARFAPLGRLERLETPAGPVLRLERAGGGRRVLLLAHYDTVHPVGAWPELWRVEGDRAYGPGVYDMKGGLLFVLWTLRYLEETGAPHPTLEVLLTPDEEIGSPESRPVIEAAARRADAVLVLEAPTGTGGLKVARKGVGIYTLRVRGKAAHQGVEPEKGVNAVVELAHQLTRVMALQDLEKGTTIGPNVVRGGTASNVVAEYAEAVIDVRAWTGEEAERVDRAIRALNPVLPGARLEVTGGINRPPMQGSRALFERARAVGARLGLVLEAGRVGGGSDGNFTAALGVPTLDGLGPFGADAHQRTEHIVVPQVPVRNALLAELVVGLMD